MAKAIMVQGTMSNAGKSLLAAGLCRIFRQDGYRVAPFKSQNMALNSFITKEGLEMGRAQVVQAEAAGIEPSVRMNPILLKPTGDSQSQVIVNGEVRGNYSAKDYFAMKKDLIPEIKKAYDSLASENDIIVIEGAGSPAEINLRENDIVNMGMAAMAHAPVLLVGDIDRGGVFAQLYGTVMLLEEEEKRYLKGLVINKFRGDVSILKPGLKQIEDLTKRPVLGVVPFLHLDIDDEDSLSERLTEGGGDSAFSAGAGLSHHGMSEAAGTVDIAVIRLPRLSNFTDFNAFQRIPGVSLRYVDSVSVFGDPDLVILPGTKNTIGDLLWLRESGLEACIKKAASKTSAGAVGAAAELPAGDCRAEATRTAHRTAVIGICGGYQMLGETLCDPYGVESGGPGGRTVRGLGLLPADTVFTREKTRTQVTGIIRHPPAGFGSLTGQKIEGYEIHMGETTIREGSDGSFSGSGEDSNVRDAEAEDCNARGAEAEDCNARDAEAEDCNARDAGGAAVPLTSLDAETGNLETIKADGCSYRNVCGTYVHGIFDSEGTAYRIAEALAAKKGVRLSQAADIDPKTYKNLQYDLLADAIRSSLNMKEVYRILHEGV